MHGNPLCGEISVNAACNPDDAYAAQWHHSRWMRTLSLGRDADLQASLTSYHTRLTSNQSLLRHLVRSRIGNFVYQALDAFGVARPARTGPEELILPQ